MRGDSALDPRVAPAERRLRELGIECARVSAAGHAADIAAVAVPTGELDRLLGPDGTRVARELKRLGFRYVAVDLFPAG